MTAGSPSPDSPGRSLSHLPALDGLRAIAVLMVLWFHIPEPCLPEWSARLVRALRPGYFGVDFFFVLSGFLITRILIDYRHRGVPLKVFFVRRFLRIFPAYYLLLAIMLVIAPSWRLICCAIYLANLEWPPLFFPPRALHHLWSLSVEEHFYLVWPFLIGLPALVTAERLVKYAVVPLAMISAVVFAIVYEGEMAGVMIWINTLPRSLSLAAGGVLAFHEKALLSAPRKWVAIAVAAVGVAGAALVVGKLYAPGDYWYVARLYAGSALSTGVVAAVICLQPGWVVTRTLALAPMRFLGQISYGLYLYHHPIYYYLLRSDESALTTTNALFAVALSFVAAVVSYNFWEKPFLRLKDVWGRPQESRLPPPSTDGAAETPDRDIGSVRHEGEARSETN